MSKIKYPLRLTALAVVLTAGCLLAVQLPSAGSASVSSAVPGIGVYSLGGHLAGIANPGLYSTVIGDAADGSTLAGLPGRSLAYFAGTDVNVNWSTGVPYNQAAANGWLLTDASGNLLTNQSYAGDYVGDVGSSSYQQAWISNVLAYLAANPGVDGVFVDDVLYDLKPLAGTEAAKYPTQQQWATAMSSFVAAVGNALRSHGYYLAVNASGYVPGDSNSDNGTNTVAWWQQLGPSVNGLMNEYYMETSNGTDTLRSTGGSWAQNWDGWQRLVATAQSMGDDFYGVMYGAAGNTAAMTYGKASFLLDWNGGGGAFMYGNNDGSDPTSSAWTTSIGTPAAAKQQVGVGWMRRYSGGVVLVDPDPTTAQTFNLGGGYLTPAGATTTSVTLQPVTAMILTATGQNATTTTATTPTTTPTTPTTTTRTTTTTTPTAGATTPTTSSTTPTTSSTAPTSSSTPATPPSGGASSPAPAPSSTTTTAATTTPTTAKTTTTTTTPARKPHGRKARRTLAYLADARRSATTAAAAASRTSHRTKTAAKHRTAATKPAARAVRRLR